MQVCVVVDGVTSNGQENRKEQLLHFFGIYFPRNAHTFIHFLFFFEMTNTSEVYGLKERLCIYYSF